VCDEVIGVAVNEIGERAATKGAILFGAAGAIAQEPG
jgi:hypothetical protein